MFVVKGKIDGKEYTLSYKNYKLSGDKTAIKKAERENKKDYGYLGVKPGDVNKDYLNYECAAFDLIDRFVFDEVIHYELDWYDEDDEYTFYWLAR